MVFRGGESQPESRISDVLGKVKEIIQIAEVTVNVWNGSHLTKADSFVRKELANEMIRNTVAQ